MTTSEHRDTVVLIVEDHADTAERLRRYLSRHGVEAEVAGSGTEALTVLSRRKPRRLIVDQTMPGMTGLQLLEYLRTNPEHREYAELPVFFYSATLERGKQAQAMALGAKGWFIKGISRLDDLMRQVMDCCHTA